MPVDPVTAGLVLANSIVVLATKIWDATPVTDQTVRASDLSKILHNADAFLQSVQGRINAAVGVAVK